jgi:uncharacterized protein YndB with AHSA1/START domain
MPTASSAIPRQALFSLLAQADEAAAGGDETKARTILSDLHWFAHADGALHQAMHRRELALARRRGDTRAARGQILPNLFAYATSFVESLGPSHEVVQSIDAPPEIVYRVVSDLSTYREWNPWVANAENVETADARVGDEIVFDVKMGKRKMRVGHRLLVASPPERFGWCDLGWFTPLARGRRLRWIEPSGAGSRLVCQIRIAGPFAALAWRLHGDAIVHGMAAEASALAKRAAELFRSPSSESAG